MCLRLLFVLFILSDVKISKSQESAQYLQSAMWNLENRLGNSQTKRRLDSLQLIKEPSDPTLEKDAGTDNVPMLSLTKGELAALYEAAVSKHRVVTPSPSDHDNPFVNAVVHELDDAATSSHDHKPSDTHTHGYSDPTGSDANGYYYYYYPINSFMDGLSSAHSAQSSHPAHDHITPESHHGVEPEKLHAQYHSHTHQHNVHITSTKNAPEKHDKKKIMEPLFMAVSSFIGMAVMFVLSIFFLPKFGGLKSRGVKQASPGELTNVAHIIFKAIEGDDCSERIVCELGKAAKFLNVHDNRFVKMLRRMTPAYVGWYVDGIGKYAHTNLTCAAIQCRRKNQPKPKPHRKRF